MDAERLEADLKAAGYRFHPGRTAGKWNDGMYQKRFEVGPDTLYFVNFYRYPEDIKTQLSFAADANLYPDDDERTVVELQINWPASLRQVETFVSLVYGTLHCVPDRHNQRGG